MEIFVVRDKSENTSITTTRAVPHNATTCNVPQNRNTHLFCSFGLPVEDGLGSFVVLPTHGSSKRRHPGLILNSEIQGWVGQKQRDDAIVGVLYGVVQRRLVLGVLGRV